MNRRYLRLLGATALAAAPIAVVAFAILLAISEVCR